MVRYVMLVMTLTWNKLEKFVLYRNNCLHSIFWKLTKTFFAVLLRVPKKENVESSLVSKAEKLSNIVYDSETENNK